MKIPKIGTLITLCITLDQSSLWMHSILFDLPGTCCCCMLSHSARRQHLEAKLELDGDAVATGEDDVLPNGVQRTHSGSRLVNADRKASHLSQHEGSAVPLPSGSPVPGRPSSRVLDAPVNDTAAPSSSQLDREHGHPKDATPVAALTLENVRGAKLAGHVDDADEVVSQAGAPRYD